MADPTSDRRQYPRAQVSFDIDVWVDGAGRQVRTAGRLVVLSAGGAFLELDEDYPVGRPLRLRFELAALGKVGLSSDSPPLSPGYRGRRRVSGG